MKGPSVEELKAALDEYGGALSDVGFFSALRSEAEADKSRERALHHKASVLAALDELERLRAETVRLRKALKEFSVHARNCAANKLNFPTTGDNWTTPPCDCGRDAALAPEPGR